MEITDNNNIDNSVTDILNLAVARSLAVMKSQKDISLCASTFAKYFMENYFYVRSYIFIYRQSSQVTNLSFLELLSLIEISATELNRTQPQQPLNFTSSEKFEEELLDFWDSATSSISEFGKLSVILHSYDDKSAADIDITPLFAILSKYINEYFIEIYSDQISHTVLHNPYLTSSVISFPLNMKFDIQKIVGSSGYISFAGDLVYMKKSTNTTMSGFKGSIDKYYRIYSETLENDTRKIPIVLYANEHYDNFELNTSKQEIRSGIDAIKIPKSKYFLGNLPISDAMDDLEQNSSGKYYIIRGLKDYNEEVMDFFWK